MTRSYLVVVNVTAAVTAGLLAHALGARGEVLIASLCIGWLPMSFFIGLVTFQLFAPDLEPTGEFRTILYGDDSVEPAPATSVDDVKRFRAGRILVNGLALIAFVCLLVASAGVFRLERILYEVVPGVATRVGPRGFPVTVRIHEDGLDFTNGSSGAWSCTSKIGIGEIPSSTFILDAAQKRFVAYESFVDGTVPLSADNGYWKAREQIIVECLDGAGLSHFASF